MIWLPLLPTATRCRLMGLRERLASAGVISFDRPTANIEAGTSVSRRISDVALTGAELPTMTQLV
jgi:hypothetical protein